ncbi:2183_t:CDS:10 [Cetraspora pellucida]|uniref:2183_t:CDS:1 n=1 Tax=Cetraspora pellucida TaxID=1433469 RepID=A0ACA9KJ75_9GLOM|nr:2183_t:CDS:10 [Cetraspora pellucida]
MSQPHLVLGVPPSSWDENLSFKIHCGISEGVIRNIEPVGRYFLAHARRKLNNHSFSEDERIQAEANAKQLEVIQDEDTEEETPELLSRDPKDWKEQDHYTILGLSKYRWKATDEQIKQAHRKKVLKHHPDKKASSGNTNDDGFFKCIQKAYEILSDPVKRRQFDSVDEAIDDTPPSSKAKGDFFEIYGPVFQREARFSNKTPVPMLGDINTTKSEVEAFYDFWYSFDSWRSFEYYDKEDTDNTDNRDDKRYIERKNKAERARYKKEDTIRLRKIIEDQALSLDPRIQKFKQEEKAAKEAKKKEKEDAIKNAKEAAQRAAEEERLKKEQAEAEAKLKQQEEKKEKANKKKVIRNERKNIKTHVKTHNYFYPQNEPPPLDVIDIQLSELDSIFEKLSLEDLQNVRKQLDSTQDRYGAKQILVKEASRLVSSGALSVDFIKYFKSDSIDVTENQVQKATDTEEHRIIEEVPKERPWSVEEISLLIKAANKFPGGSLNRISEYVADHSGLPSRTNEELIKKSKEVQKGTTALDGNDVRKLQYQKKHADTRITENPSMREATINYDASPTMSTASAPTANGPAATSNVWAAAQQAQLERALQAYPPSWKGVGDRWDKIAEAVENKTKKECKLRVKYLAEQVKAKKAAQST